MTPAWWRVTVSCDPTHADRIAAELVTRTGHAVEQADAGTILAVATSADDARQLVGDLVARYGGLEGVVTELDPVDWSVRWRDGIVTRRFGRLVISPSWLPVAATGHEVVVTLDPESAFGSGEHGSTRAAMTLLERLIVPGHRMLDLGSGSGILAIAAATLGASSAIGIEVDDESNPIAEANARRNGVSDRVTFLLGDAGELAVLAGPAEVVCSNILRTVNTLLLPHIARALAPGGVAIFSGMEDAEEPLFRPVLAAAGFSVVDDVHDAGWWGVAARLR